MNQNKNILFQHTLTGIRDFLMDEQNIPPQPGLFGKMGVSLFFFYYADYTGDEKYEDYAVDLITLMQKQINAHSPLNYNIGLTGIGTAFEHLIQQGMLDIETNDILHYFDLLFQERLEKQILYLSLNEILDMDKYFRCRFSDKKSNLEQQTILDRIEYILDLHIKVSASFYMPDSYYLYQQKAFIGLDILSQLDERYLSWKKIL
jgi:hypothetical protein